MTTLSTEALMVSIRSLFQEQKRIELQLQDLDPESEEAELLGDDALQLVRILGELSDLYEIALKDEKGYPSYNEIRESVLG